MFRSSRPRRIALIAGVLASFIGLAACSQGESSSKSDKTTIAISFPNYSRTPSLQVVAKYAKAEAKRLNVKLILDDPGSDLDKQVSTINTWIPQKYGAIIAVALDASVLEGVAKHATDSGTKWITYGSSLKSEDGQIDLDQATGGETLGHLAAEWFNKNLDGKGKVALLTYNEGEWAKARAKGIEAALKAEAPGVEIVARQDALSETEGLNATKTILQAHPDLSGVIAIEDSAAVGAYGALPDSKSSKIFVGGIDGTVDALRLIQAGDNAYRGSAALDLKALGKGMVQAGVNAAKGTGSATYKVTYVPIAPGSTKVAAMIADQD